MSSIIIGIDPGLSGGLVFLDVDTQSISCYVMPVKDQHFMKNGKKSMRPITDLTKMKDIIESEIDGKHVIVSFEKVSGGVLGGKQGTSAGSVSSFRFGKNVGHIEGVLVGCGVKEEDIQYVVPTVWKRYFGLSRDKKESIDLACKEFPRNVSDFTINPDTGRKKMFDGIAEAALIAKYRFDKLKKEGKI